MEKGIKEIMDKFKYFNFGDSLYFYAKNNDKAQEIEEYHMELENPDDVNGILIKESKNGNELKVKEYYSGMNAIIDLDTKTINFRV